MLSFVKRYAIHATRYSMKSRMLSTATRADDKLVVTEVVEQKFFLIGINRPEKRNCVNHATARQLSAAFEEFDRRDDLLSAVLYGNGGCFCAGYDLAEVGSGQVDEMKSAVNELPAAGFRPMGPSMMRFTKPVIAAIDGYAVAGGLELACMCDMRVMEETAIMGVFCRRFGVPLIDGGTIRLPQLIGFSRAMDLILTGREVNAKEALEIGLVNRVVATGTALGQALQIARLISKFPQQCLKADRRSAYYSTFDAKNWNDAFRFEWENGWPIVRQESVPGASRFAFDKVGRHGSFKLNTPPGPKSNL